MDPNGESASVDVIINVSWQFKGGLLAIRSNDWVTLSFRARALRLSLWWRHGIPGRMTSPQSPRRSWTWKRSRKIGRRVKGVSGLSIDGDRSKVCHGDCVSRILILICLEYDMFTYHLINIPHPLIYQIIKSWSTWATWYKMSDRHSKARI